ncbi:MAG: hypothetical protein QXQ39_06600 [Conexivisphaerales archaeon]
MQVVVFFTLHGDGGPSFCLIRQSRNTSRSRKSIHPQDESGGLLPISDQIKL